MFADLDNFPKRLAEAVSLSGLSARQVALRAGLSPSYVSELLSGKRSRPSVESVHRLAAATGAANEYLFAGKGGLVASEQEKALQRNVLEGGGRFGSVKITQELSSSPENSSPHSIVPDTVSMYLNQFANSNAKAIDWYVGEIERLVKSYADYCKSNQ
jgi:transcriptional regulator with XRE-family HTH domain